MGGCRGGGAARGVKREEEEEGGRRAYRLGGSAVFSAGWIEERRRVPGAEGIELSSEAEGATSKDKLGCLK
ncbi:hypothetical protein WN55_08275 [Dufourea novaeangliae]|uniref:Uncharacterized protein n=1 Tax=Dufourea novaeangliae TaxID=178035 RepID=A0A154P841_DUFNO|nr:hypothetical protein WN55_08275 [Dufourea novaeangliae]